MPNCYNEEDNRGTIFFSGSGSSAAAAWSSSFSFPPPFSFPSLSLGVQLVKPPVVAGHGKDARAPDVPLL